MTDLIKNLIDLLDSKKAGDIVAIDVKEVTTIADYVIVVTANSNVHAGSLGRYTVEYFLDSDYKDFMYKKNVELNNPWILIDAKDVIVHIFQKQEREFYSIEKLYSKGTIIYKS
ncbi:MAG TPA: ribosome silencing factor [Spirochaetota bacterium]|jgi:ribosome-associated protein|nr:MAG: Ribosomal silencing factor RsfS [Spirochaetes bacterium ADurb.Bin133]HNZ26837.1 ribosome silencing factor [Spirochaetota bacterium]HOF01486.1 ribosome silencing factor [Spirochaetota bacterium]HOS31717.1 ribosome silencing factor [Spirochaetota bacterium]HOS54948.1 ribosome silencing factor [Spirochaetota bacterium]